MCIRAINQIWEKLRLKKENDLKEILDKEIENLHSSYEIEEEKNPQNANSIFAARVHLIIKKSLLYYETEEMVRRQIGLICSIITIVIGFIALIISIIAIK